MGENTKIEWATHTFNAWIGCTKVSPACDGCYAENLMDARLGRVQWGAGGDRSRTSEANWKQPLKWDRAAKASGKPATVFCLSLGDVWDSEVDPRWRSDLMDLISATPNLVWLLLSKRIGNAVKMCEPAAGHRLLPPNAALGSTMVNQAEWDRDEPKLREAARVLSPLFTFASVEPMLGPIDARGNLPGWVIVGGETDQGPHKARPMSTQWPREMRDQCAAAGVPFLFKQWGEWAPARHRHSGEPGRFAFGDYEHNRSAMVQVDSYPREFTRFGARSTVERLGKKAAGRLLDSVEHNGMPEVIRG